MTIIPFLNPIKWVKMHPDVIPQYVSKHMDDWRFSETILPWEQKVCWNQPWLYQDSIRQQLMSDVGPIRLRLMDKDDRVWYDGEFAQKQKVISWPDMYLYENDLALSVVTKPGRYYLRMDIGDDESETQVSEFLYISENIENGKEKTLLLEYRHKSYYGDVIFEKGFSPSIRIPGIIKHKSAKAVTSSWVDQGQRTKIIKRSPYDIWSWVIGTSKGVPPWVVSEKINYILGCSELKLDGRLYTVNEEAEFEEFTEKNYPLRGYSIEMRPSLNRSSRIVESGPSSNGPIMVIANTDSKGFGMNSGNSTYQILDIS